MLTLAADYQEPSVVQDLEVVRDRGLGEREPLADLAAGELARRRELLDHPKASRLRQGLQDAKQGVTVHALAMAIGVPRIPSLALSVPIWNTDAGESFALGDGSNQSIPPTEVMAMKAVRTFAALLLALGLLTTASAALADRGDDAQAPRGERPEDIQSL